MFDELQTRTYCIKPSIAFIVKEPKPREVFAAAFRDRIVHHLLFNYLNPILEEVFLPDSYSCRVGRGTGLGIKRAESFVKNASNDFSQQAYVLKLDVKNYFGSIDRMLLLQMLRNMIKPRWSNTTISWGFIDYLLKMIVLHDPVKNCLIKGNRANWNLLPAEKSLFNAKSGKGLAIGNLTSQLFANVMLHELDTFVTKGLNIRCYGRYVDDFILVHQDKKVLSESVDPIRQFLKERLKLEHHEKKIYLQDIHKGFLFLGAYVKPRRIYIANRTKGNFYRKIKFWNTQLKKSDFNSDATQLRVFVSCINSYLGLFAQYSTYSIRRKAVLNWLDSGWFQYVNFDSTYTKCVIKNEISYF